MSKRSSGARPSQTATSDQPGSGFGLRATSPDLTGDGPPNPLTLRARPLGSFLCCTPEPNRKQGQLHCIHFPRGLTDRCGSRPLLRSGPDLILSLSWHGVSGCHLPCRNYVRERCCTRGELLSAFHHSSSANCPESSCQTVGTDMTSGDSRGTGAMARRRCNGVVGSGTFGHRRGCSRSGGQTNGSMTPIPAAGCGESRLDYLEMITTSSSLGGQPIA